MMKANRWMMPLVVLFACSSVAAGATLLDDSENTVRFFDPVTDSRQPPRFQWIYPIDIRLHPINDEVRTCAEFATRETAEPDSAELVLSGSCGPVFYRANEGDILSRQTINRGEFEYFGGWFDTFNTISVPIGSDFWIAADIFNDNGAPQVNYGWMQLNVAEDLTVSLIDSAIAFDSDQIVVGQNVFSNGDINADGVVDAADLNVLGEQWLQNVTGVANGDLTGDAIVDAADLNIVGKNWLRTPEQPAAVPEPEGRVLILTFLVCTCGWRRR